MEIGFVNFDQEALNRANKVMRLLQGQGAIDELGLGRIRDAFSNSMFPGMSTLQTRAKYFLLIPALYSFLERTIIQDSGDARRKVREYEISFTRRLIDNADPANSWGVIGVEALKNRGSFVKYDPAYVYHSGMETYGLIQSGGNIYRMIAERSHLNQTLPQKYRDSENEEGDDDGLKGIHQTFKTCGEDYDFRGKSPLSMRLSQKEAEFLRHQIITHTPESLLGWLLDSGSYTKIAEECETFESLKEVLKATAPEKLYRIYRLAWRYSHFALLLRMRYAMLYDKAVGAEKADEEEKAFFEEYERYTEEFKPEAIQEILDFASTRVTEDSCKIFCSKASELVTANDWDNLDQLIVKREIAIKGMKRSKLMNVKEYAPGKPFQSPAIMAFRWNTIVRTVLTEISEGLK